MIGKTLTAALAVAVLAAQPGAAFAAADDVAKHPACAHCGMDRGKWDFSRAYVEYGDGSSAGTCSIHCAAVELALSLDKFPAAIRIADHDTRGLIDAEQAVWVIGGTKPGVMTRRAKWAFADRTAAEAFVAEHQGTIATFEEAIRGAYLDMYEDTRMIRERRAAKRKAAAEAAAPRP